MDIYVERDNDSISLEEWIEYVNNDNELVLQETSQGINPITKQVMKINIPGHVTFGEYEIYYKNGCIGTDDYSDELLEKLREIAEFLDAEIYE